MDLAAAFGGLPFFIMATRLSISGVEHLLGFFCCSADNYLCVDAVFFTPVLPHHRTFIIPTNLPQQNFNK